MTTTESASQPIGVLRSMADRAVQILAQRHAGRRLQSLTLLAQRLTERAVPAAFGGLGELALAGLLEQMLAMLEGCGENEAVTLHPLEKPGHYWLVACAFDVPYLFDAVVGFVKQRVMRFRVVSHPVLNVRLREGKIQLVRGDRKVSRLSLMVFELQSFLPEESSDLVDDVHRLVQGMARLAEDQPALTQCLESLQDFADADGYGAFWRWLQAGNFEPVAYRCLDIRLREDGELVLYQQHDATVGFIPGNWEVFPETGQCLCEMPMPFRQRMLRHETVTVVPGEQPSPVRPEEPLLFLALRENIDPELCREHVFAGMPTPRGACRAIQRCPLCGVVFSRFCIPSGSVLTVTTGAKPWRF